MRAGDGAPALQAVLVAVDAADEQALAVEQDHAVADLHGLKADGAGLHVHGAAALARQLHDGAVEHGLLRAPELHMGQVHADAAGVHGGRAVLAVLGAGLDLAAALAHALAVAVVEGQPHAAVRKAVGTGDGHVADDLARPVVEVRDGGDLVVLNGDARLGEEHDRAGDAAQVPIVLVLQVAGVRKVHHLHGQQVLPRAAEVRDVELAGELAVLGKAGALAVDEDVVGGLRALKAQDQAAALKAHGQAEGAAVAAGGVLPRDVGRVGLELPAGLGPDVGILLPILPGVDGVRVDGQAVALRLPAAGHGDAAPGAVVKVLLPEGLHRLRPVVELEPPSSQRMLEDSRMSPRSASRTLA